MAFTKEDKDKVIKILENITLQELNDLVKTIETHFDVSAKVTVAPAEDSISEQKTDANIILTEIEGGSKIGIIKYIKTLMNSGLMEAKKLTETLPVHIKNNVPLAEAEEIKAKFTELGAVVELK